MRRLGKMFFLVSFDFSDIAEQLNFAEVILQVIGSSSFVRGEIVQTVDTHESSCGHDSVIDKFPLPVRVNVWKRGSVAGLVEAFID